MILKEESTDILSGGLMKETDFSMDENSLHIVFDILRSKVYKDPISSICREVASNSRDAQREIGDFTTPVEIEIMDHRDSMWIEDGLNIVFRDFGIGLTPDRVENVYSKYGASTKRNTNTMTGGFGLGAKTPFSYSDLFVVRTIVDNVEYHYTIYIDESKKGKIALINEEIKQHNGNLTEIIIPIKNNNDLNNFKVAVLKNTYFWSVRPKLIGFGNDYTYNSYGYKVDVLKDVANDYIVAKTNTVVHSNLNAIIDGIYYPIDTNIMSKYKNDYGFAFLLHFGNGELSVSANRESLQYDDDTKAKITTKIDRVFTELSTQLQASIDRFSTMYEVIMFLDSKNGYYSSVNTLESFLIKHHSFIWNGKPVPKSKPAMSLKSYKIHCYSWFNGLLRNQILDVYSSEMFKAFNEIYFQDEMNFKSDPQRTNTLKGKTWVVISRVNKDFFVKKHQINFEDRCAEEKKMLEDLGLNLKNYDDIVRTPNPKADRKPRVKKPVEAFKKITFRVKTSYDYYSSYEFCINKTTGDISRQAVVKTSVNPAGTIQQIPCKIVYFIDDKDDDALQREIHNFDSVCSDFSTIFNQGLSMDSPDYTYFCRIPLSKKDYAKNGITVEEFIKEPSTFTNGISKILIRQKIGYDDRKFHDIMEMNIDPTFKTILAKYEDICDNINMSGYTGLKYMVDKYKLQSQVENPYAIFEEIEKKYPLINQFKTTSAANKYLDLVNEHIKLKEDFNHLNSII